MEIEPPWRMGLERSEALIVSCCAGEVRMDDKQYCVLKGMWACSSLPKSLKWSSPKKWKSLMMWPGR